MLVPVGILRVVLTVVATAGAGNGDTPDRHATGAEFTAYAAEARLTGAVAAPQMKIRKARQFRTVLREAASQGPNFNGHYRVVHWGCGSNCIEWAVIDLVDGSEWFAPEPASSCWAPGEPTGLEWPEWIEARVESRLLYLHECDGGAKVQRTFDVRNVYEWRGGAPVLLRSDRFLAKGDSASK